MKQFEIKDEFKSLDKKISKWSIVGQHFPTEAEIDWLDDWIVSAFPNDIPSPMIHSGIDAMLRWEFGYIEISLEIDLLGKIGLFNSAVAVDNYFCDVEESFSFELADPVAVAKLIRKLRTFRILELDYAL